MFGRHHFRGHGASGHGDERGGGGRCGERERHARDHHGPLGWLMGRGGMRGEGPMGRGGGRGGRFFDHGDLKLVILELIAGSPRHGYEVIKAIDDMTGGAYSPSPGVVYPTLTMLEDLGYVTVEPVAGNKKLHQITETGRAYLEDNRAAVTAIFQRMDEIGEAQGAGSMPQLFRAMHNIKLALRLRLGRGSLSPEQVQAITAALDAAASAIERV